MTLKESIAYDGIIESIISTEKCNYAVTFELFLVMHVGSINKVLH